MSIRATAVSVALMAGVFLQAGGVSSAWAQAVARLGPVTIPGAGPDRLMLGMGAFNFNLRGPARFDTRALEGEAEFQSGARLYGIGPTAGLMTTTRGGLMGYIGLYTRFRYRHIFLTPEFAVGAYHRGSGKYLGGALEFRPSVSIAWQFRPGQRLGVQFAHISNGGLHQRNPSEQELLLVYSVVLH